MCMTTTPQTLERKIESIVERLVREHLAVVEAAAAAAVRAGVRRATRPKAAKARAGVGAAQERPASERRPREVVAKLEERARLTGATLAEVAKRVLVHALEEDAGWTTGADGLPLYVGPTEGIDLDHRTVREERIEHFLRGFGEGSR